MKQKEKESVLGFYWSTVISVFKRQGNLRSKRTLGWWTGEGFYKKIWSLIFSAHTSCNTEMESSWCSDLSLPALPFLH